MVTVGVTNGRGRKGDIRTKERGEGQDDKDRTIRARTIIGNGNRNGNRNIGR